MTSVEAKVKKDELNELELKEFCELQKLLNNSIFEYKKEYIKRKTFASKLALILGVVFFIILLMCSDVTFFFLAIICFIVAGFTKVSKADLERKVNRISEKTKVYSEKMNDYNRK